MLNLRLAGNVQAENWSHEVRLPGVLAMLLVLLVVVLLVVVLLVVVLLVVVLLVVVLLVVVVLVRWFCQIGVEFSSTVIESMDHMLAGDTFDTFVSG